MHKLHIITKPDGTLLIIGVLNPGMPWHYAEKTRSELKAQFGAATVAVVPYATSVEVHDSTLWGAIKRWWRGRRLQKEGEVQG